MSTDMNLDTRPESNVAIRNALAPTGRLRAVINLGNPVLAKPGAPSQPPTGISVDLAREMADRLDVALDLHPVDAAAESVAAVAAEVADVGFFAVDPLRGAAIAFSDAYLLIEGCYLVRESSPIRSSDEVDRPGHRIVVGKGSAYDLYLARETKQATLERAPTSPLVVDTFLSSNADVAAGVRQQLEADAARIPGLRLLPGRFMGIKQAMGVPRSRGGAAAAWLHAFAEEMKLSGFIVQAMTRHGVEGVTIAPAA